MKVLFWSTLFLASSVCLSQIVVQGSYGVPLEDIEDELDELLEGPDGEEVVIYYSERYGDDDGDDDMSDESIEESDEFVDDYSSEDSSSSEESSSEDSSEERGGRRKNKKKGGDWLSRQRQAVKKIKQYMRRHNMSEIGDVPGRKFGEGLRRIHNRWEDNEEGRRGKAAKIYRKVIRVVEKRIEARDGGKFDRICEKLPGRDEPRRKIQAALPDFIRDQFLDMFDNRMNQLEECCDLEGEDELQEECFEDAYYMKMDDLCTIQLQMGEEITDSSSRFIQKLGERQECCQILEPSARAECFKEGGRRVREARRSRSRRSVGARNPQNALADWRNLTPQEKVDKLCERVEQSGDAIINRRASKRPRFQNARRDELEERFEAIGECCDLAGSARLDCANALKRARLEQLCDEPLARVRGVHGQERQELRETCCEMRGAQKERCFDDAVLEHLTERRERKLERREDRGGVARVRGRANGRVAKTGRRANGAVANNRMRRPNSRVAKERRQAHRQQERRQDRRQQRSVRVEVQEELETPRRNNRHRNRRAADDRMDTPAGGRDRRQRVGKGSWRRNRGQERDEDFDREEHRELMEECCEQGQEYGETIDIPNDGMARKALGNMCYTKAREVSFEIHENDIDRKCMWNFKKCCYTSHFEMEEGRGRRKNNGRRRKVRVEIEEDLDEEDGDDVIEDLIDMAEVMVVDAQM